MVEEEEAKGYAQHFDKSLAILSEEGMKITKAKPVLGQLLVSYTENSDINIDEITILLQTIATTRKDI